MENKRIETSYGKLNITHATIDSIKRYPRMYTRSPIRTRMGRIYTNEEFRNRSDEVLSKRLPGEEKVSVLKRIFKRKK